MSGIIYRDGHFFQTVQGMNFPLNDFLTPVNAPARIHEILEALLAHSEQEAAQPLIARCEVLLAPQIEPPREEELPPAAEPVVALPAEPKDLGPLTTTLYTLERSAGVMCISIQPKPENLDTLMQAVQGIRNALEGEEGPQVEGLLQRCERLEGRIQRKNAQVQLKNTQAESMRNAPPLQQTNIPSQPRAGREQQRQSWLSYAARTTGSVATFVGLGK